MKNNLLFTTTINAVVLKSVCLKYQFVQSFFNQKNWKLRLTLTVLPFLFFTFFIHQPCLFIRLIKISGDVDGNPGPKRYSAQYLIICHWSPQLY